MAFPEITANPPKKRQKGKMSCLKKSPGHIILIMQSEDKAIDLGNQIPMS